MDTRLFCIGLFWFSWGTTMIFLGRKNRKSDAYQIGWVITCIASIIGSIAVYK